MLGKLIFGGMHSGNIKDTPLRTLEAFDYADIVAVEWKDHYEWMFSQLGKYPKGEIIQYNGLMDNSEQIEDILIDYMKNGKTVLLLACDGMPVISDPGSELGQKAKFNNIPVTVIPGPNMAIAALVVSGVDAWKFTYESEIAEFSEDRLKQFDEIKHEIKAIIYIATRNQEAARYANGKVNENWLLETLEDMLKVFGSKRPIALCFDISLPNELIWRGDIKDSISWAKENKHNGFLTIVLEGYRPNYI